MAVYVNCVRIQAVGHEVRLTFLDEKPGQNPEVVIEIVMTRECFRGFCELATRQNKSID